MLLLKIQLVAITEQIENLNKLVERVEKGQYNDRFAGFFSARQAVIEGFAAKDRTLGKELLTSAIKINNETIAKLMFDIHQDSKTFINLNTKPKDAKRIDNLIQNSIGYLNASVQLNLIIYSAMGEEQPLLVTLTNYQTLIELPLKRY